MFLYNQLIEDDLESTLLDFVKTKANSFIKWDLARFFYENPQTIDTAENIAQHIGRDLSKVKLELEDLVEDGLVEKRGLNGSSHYSLGRDDETRALVNKFVLACEDRHFRVKAVQLLIGGRQQ